MATGLDTSTHGSMDNSMRSQRLSVAGDNDEAIPRRPGDSKRLPGVSGTTPSGSRSVHRMTTFQLLWLALRASCQVCAA